MAKGKGKSSSRVPKDESKAARFIRVVTPRVAKAVKAISVIGYCSGSTYEYTTQQIQQIVNALENAQGELLARFAGKKSGQEEFTFKT